MAFYHKWDFKNGFPYVLQFLSLISDSLGGVFSSDGTNVYLNKDFPALSKKKALHSLSGGSIQLFPEIWLLQTWAVLQ